MAGGSLQSIPEMTANTPLEQVTLPKASEFLSNKVELLHSGLAFA
jgi:hypothetical protein